ncbi:MAG: hypothetical protein JST01_16395 [Cyanobacteria bacterium SZAS TMP-1]|nr:hypothetical protein [Cyanobacteria bacterium SZAS TMP-1]
MNTTDYLAIISVFGTLAALIAVAPKLSAMFALDAEDTRKFVHLIMGLSCFSFPWLFSSALPLIFLLVIVCLGMLILRKGPENIYKKVLFGVKRNSLGEIFFPLAVTILFILARHNFSFYLIPVSLLALADSLAALVGRRLGVRKYRSLDGSKTIEGSFAFFTTSFICSLVVLALVPLQFHSYYLIVSLILALVATACEGMSFGGLDNLLVPLGAYYALVRCARLSGPELLYHFLVLLAITVTVLMLKQRTTLEGGATLAVLIYGFAAHAMGGFLWFSLPIILFAFYRLLLPVRFQNTSHSVLAVCSVGLGGLAWLCAYDRWETPGFIYPYALGLAINASIIASAHIRLHELNSSRTMFLKLLIICKNACKSAGMIMLPLFLTTGKSWLLIANIFLSPLWIIAFTLIFLLIKNQNPLKITSNGRWFKQCLCSSLGSLFAFVATL